MKQKIKLIIEVDQKYYEACKDAVEESYPSQIEEIIANGTPYNPTGDCISRDVLKEAITPYKGKAISTSCILDIIDKAQIVEVSQKGKWLHSSDRPDNLICSVCNCGWDMWRYESKELKYCPNCGADMGGGEQENEQ